MWRRPGARATGRARPTSFWRSTRNTSSSGPASASSTSAPRRAAGARSRRLGLAPGGFFLAKVLQGGTEGELLARLKREFAAVRHVKPKASRADSAELYLLATGFRGRPAPEA